MARFSLSELLTRTLEVEIVNGTATFTNLAILLEGQGFVLKFEVAEGCCGELCGSIGGLKIIKQPQNTTIGEDCAVSLSCESLNRVTQMW